MDPVHLHLLVNHLPIVGTILALPILGLALLGKSGPGAFHSAVLLLVISAGGAVVANSTGEGAEDGVESLPGVSDALIEEHEERAEVALALSIAAGVGALGLLGFSAIRRRPPGRALLGLLTALTIAAAAAMAWTGNSGGVIRHTELRTETPATPEPQGD